MNATASYCRPWSLARAGHVYRVDEGVLELVLTAGREVVVTGCTREQLEALLAEGRPVPQGVVVSAVVMGAPWSLTRC